MSTRRQTKAANTRIGLLEAALERLDDRPLSEIPAKELADAAGVSTATFFNYFPSKDDLLALFVLLWSVEMAWTVDRHPPDDPLGAIEAMFTATARSAQEHPGILAEIITFEARHRWAQEHTPPTDADVLRRYPDHPGIVHTRRDAGLDALVPPLLQRARDLGHLDANAPLSLMFAAVGTIFFGAPIIVRQAPTLPLELAWQSQLRWLWAAHAPTAPTESSTT